MKKSSLLYFALSNLMVSLSFANGPIERDPNQTNVNAQPSMDQNELRMDSLRQKQLSDSSKTGQNPNVVRYSGKELIEHPDVLENLLLDALISTNQEMIPIYLKLYEHVPNADRSLVEWGYAIVLRNVDLTKSTVLYRSLIKNFPNNNFIRFQFAETLFYNQQFQAAKQEFEKLKESKSVTQQDQMVFDQYLDAINSKESWNFSFSGTFLNDKNLTNSAKQGTMIKVPNGTITWNSPRQEGKGVGAGFGIDKQWTLQNGKYIKFNSNIYSKYYWDNKKYNDVNAHLGVGFGYANARSQLEITPYVSKRWYAGGANSTTSLKQYSNTYGSNFLASYWLTPKFKYSANYNFGYERYDRSVNAHQYNGAIHSLSNSLLYFPHQGQYWSISLDLAKKYASDKSNAYNRIGTRLTWGQEWPLGFGTSTTLGYAKRNYLESTFLGKQKNKEMSISLSLWNKNISVLGFIPRITWNYTKTDSNIAIYSYNKNQVFFDVAKSF